MSVDVSVLARNQPVLGLQSIDFELRDNGVKQAVTAILVELVPLDVSLVLDETPGLERSAAGARLPTTIEMIRADLPRIVASLRPVDRVRIILTLPEPQEVVHLSAADRGLASLNVVSRFQTSLANAAIEGVYGVKTPPSRTRGRRSARSRSSRT